MSDKLLSGAVSQQRPNFYMELVQFTPTDATRPPQLDPSLLSGGQGFFGALHEQVALIVTTNLAFSDWPQVFGDERLTAALIDRLTYHAHVFEFRGQSYRFRARRPKGSTMT